MIPKVSIIMPVFNKEKTLIQSIQTILDQTISDWELIAIDDNSEDNSQNILSIIKEPRMKKLFLPANMGAVNAYKMGIKKARAKYVMFHDSDDVSLPDRAEKCLGGIGDADILYHAMYVISSSPDYPIISKRYFPAHKWDKDRIFRGQYIPGVVFGKKSALEKVDIPKGAENAWDWMNHIKLHEMGAKYKALNTGLYEYYRFPGNSLSHKNELEGTRQESIKFIQGYLKKKKFVPDGHRFTKGFKGEKSVNPFK